MKKTDNLKRLSYLTLAKTTPDVPFLRAERLHRGFKITVGIPSLALRVVVTISLEIGNVSKSGAPCNSWLSDIVPTKVSTRYKCISIQLTVEAPTIWSGRRCRWFLDVKSCQQQKTSTILVFRVCATSNNISTTNKRTFTFRKTIPNMPFAGFKWFDVRLEITKRVPALTCRVSVAVLFQVGNVTKPITSTHPRLCNIVTTKVLACNEIVPLQLAIK